MNFSIDAQLCQRGVTVLAAVGTLMGSLDLLYNRHILRDSGCCAWKAVRVRFELLRDVRLFHDPSFNWVIVVRALAAVAVLVAVVPTEPLFRLASVAAVLLFLTQWMLNVRINPDGAGNMETLLWGGLLFSWLLPHDEVVRAASLWFVALQSCLCYYANGWVKVKHGRWRSGDVMRHLFDHPLFGSPLLAGISKRLPWAGRTIISGTAFVELIFPLVLVVGFPWAWLFIAWGVLFHSGNAVFMGLHHFWYPFLATYPAILFCAAQIRPPS